LPVPIIRCFYLTSARSDFFPLRLIPSPRRFFRARFPRLTTERCPITSRFLDPLFAGSARPFSSCFLVIQSALSVRDATFLLFSASPGCSPSHPHFCAVFDRRSFDFFPTRSARARLLCLAGSIGITSPSRSISPVTSSCTDDKGYWPIPAKESSPMAQILS